MKIKVLEKLDESKLIEKRGADRNNKTFDQITDERNDKDTIWNQLVYGQFNRDKFGRKIDRNGHIVDEDDNRIDWEGNVVDDDDEVIDDEEVESVDAEHDRKLRQDDEEVLDYIDKFENEEKKKESSKNVEMKSESSIEGDNLGEIFSSIMKNCSLSGDADKAVEFIDVLESANKIPSVAGLKNAFEVIEPFFVKGCTNEAKCEFVPTEDMIADPEKSYGFKTGDKFNPYKVVKDTTGKNPKEEGWYEDANLHGTNSLSYKLKRMIEIKKATDLTQINDFIYNFLRYLEDVRIIKDLEKYGRFSTAEKYSNLSYRKAANDLRSGESLKDLNDLLYNYAVNRETPGGESLNKKLSGTFAPEVAAEEVVKTKGTSKEKLLDRLFNYTYNKKLMRGIDSQFIDKVRRKIQSLAGQGLVVH